MLKLFQILLSTIVISLITCTDISAQEMPDTSKVLLKFSEPMSRDGIFNINNYIIYHEDDTLVEIYKVGIVPGDSAVVLFTEKHTPQASYKIIIQNLKDKSGNIISENHRIASY